MALRPSIQSCLITVGSEKPAGMSATHNCPWEATGIRAGGLVTSFQSVIFMPPDRMGLLPGCARMMSGDVSVPPSSGRMTRVSVSRYRPSCNRMRKGSCRGDPWVRRISRALRTAACKVASGCADVPGYPSFPAVDTWISTAIDCRDSMQAGSQMRSRRNR